MARADQRTPGRWDGSRPALVSRAVSGPGWEDGATVRAAGPRPLRAAGLGDSEQWCVLGGRRRSKPAGCRESGRGRLARERVASRTHRPSLRDGGRAWLLSPRAWASRPHLRGSPPGSATPYGAVGTRQGPWLRSWVGLRGVKVAFREVSSGPQLKAGGKAGRAFVRGGAHTQGPGPVTRGHSAGDLLCLPCLSLGLRAAVTLGRVCSHPPLSPPLHWRLEGPERWAFSCALGPPEWTHPAPRTRVLGTGRRPPVAWPGTRQVLLLTNRSLRRRGRRARSPHSGADLPLKHRFASRAIPR